MSGAGQVQGALRLVVVGAIVLSAFVVRVVTSSSSELSLGEQSEQRGELEAAVGHYRRAARWYAPGSPYHARALAALAQVGAAAEKDGDLELALSAYRAIRSGIMSSRSVFTPERERLTAANGRIADLMASYPPPPMDAGKSREQLRQEHLALLSADHDPKLGWTLLLLLGFALWVGSALAFTVRAIDGDRWVPKEMRRWGALVIVGLAMFIAGMALA